MSPTSSPQPNTQRFALTLMPVTKPPSGEQCDKAPNSPDTPKGPLMTAQIDTMDLVVAMTRAELLAAREADQTEIAALHTPRLRATT